MDKEYYRRMRSRVKAKNSIYDLIEVLRVADIQLRNAEDALDKNKIDGVSKDTIHRINEKHMILDRGLHALYEILDNADAYLTRDCSAERSILRDLVVDIEHEKWDDLDWL